MESYREIITTDCISIIRKLTHDFNVELLEDSSQGKVILRIT